MPEGFIFFFCSVGSSPIRTRDRLTKTNSMAAIINSSSPPAQKAHQQQTWSFPFRIKKEFLIEHIFLFLFLFVSIFLFFIVIAVTLWLSPFFWWKRELGPQKKKEAILSLKAFLCNLTIANLSALYSHRNN